MERQDDTSGDYEYDEAHERPAGERPAAQQQPRPASAPASPAEPDGDMSYDEAHDF